MERKEWKAAMLAALSLVWLVPMASAANERAAIKDTKPTSRLTGEILIVGSTTMAPIMTLMAQRFESLHPGVRVSVEGGGSRRALTDIRSGKADIGMMTRVLSEDESDLVNYPIMRDGVTFIVHKDNPVRELTHPQIRDIYTGKITNWQQVGGRDAPIQAMGVLADRSSTVQVTEYFDFTFEQMKAQIVLGDTLDRIKILAAAPDGIMYFSVGTAERMARSGMPIKLLPLGGVEAASKSVRNGDFPLSRGLSLVTKQIPRGIVKEFINFCMSSQVADIVIKHDFVPYSD